MNHFELINFLRWFSAFLVVINHLRSFLFVNYIDLVDPINVGYKFFYFITGFGHQAVIIFFAISGYLVGGKVFSTFSSNLFFDYRKYFVNRFSRIFIVLVPALCIILVLDFFGQNNFPELYNGSLNISSFNINTFHNFSLNSFFFNLVNLQTIFADPFGSFLPSWSLSNEWFYYLIFPLFFIKSFFSLLIIFVCFLILFFFNPSILIYGIIWVFAALISNLRFSFKSFLFFSFFFVLLFFYSRFSNSIYLDLVLGVVVGLMIVSSKYLQLFSLPPIPLKFNRIFSDFSYSLYATHFSFIPFIISIIYIFDFNLVHLHPSFFNIFIYLIFLLLLYLIAFFFFFLFESRTASLRSYLTRTLL